MLGNVGNILICSTNTIKAIPPIPPNVARQPNHCPTKRPKGTPNTIANEVPVASTLSANAFLPSGATRIAIAAVMDQNIACDIAIPTRLMSSTSKLHANTDNT